MGYQKPRGAKAGGLGTYTLDDMKNEDRDPIWSAHLDQDTNEVYYFNRLT